MYKRASDRIFKYAFNIQHHTYSLMKFMNC